ncbi:MAG: hypothetical protein IJX13_03490, partial [Clostridia bacterium]|nr:hypothetical protein [Clostridia bacterium]
DRVAKYTSCVAATLALTLAIVFIVLIGSYLDKFNYDKFYAIGISAGIIVMSVFAIGSILLPSRIKDALPTEKTLDEECVND